MTFKKKFPILVLFMLAYVKKKSSFSLYLNKNSVIFFYC